MASFRFRLEQVLRYRKQLEDQAKQALAEVMALLQQEREKREQIEFLLQDHQARLANAAGLTADEMWLVQNYVAVLLHDRDESRQRERALQEAEDRCRTELIQKAKERDLLDTLKEKQAARHQIEEKHLEQRVYDETATLRSQRQSF